MMKKLLTIIFAVILITPCIGVFSEVKVKAAEGPFYVEYIKDDGSFEEIEVFDNYDEAYQKMQENEDYVIRHENSLSPLKIIAMNSGFAYSYPYRSGSNTQYIYESINDKNAGCGATSYVTAYYEMTYHKTSYLHNFRSGYIGGYCKVTLNGFTGYADLEYVDLIPTKFVEKGLVAKIGGHDKTGGGRGVKNVKLEQNYYYASKKDNYTDLVFAFHQGYPNGNGDALKYEIRIGVAPSFMEEGKKYYSNDGINYFSDTRLTNKVGTYYNYYQFLPLRSYSKISEDTLDDYLNEKAGSDSILIDHASDFLNNQNKYGVNGVTILSMAIHESGWGKSNIAKSKNNLFGWGAYDDNTAAAKRYASVSDSIAAQMADNLANYMDANSGKYYWTMSLGNKGGGFVLKYASDPYWAEKISAYYYDIDKYANDYNGKLTDYDTYTLALINKPSDVKRQANANSETLYSTENKNTGYQKNLLAIVLGDENGYSKTQLSNPIDEDGDVIFPIELAAGTLVKYDKDRSVGYISNSNVEIVNRNSSLSKPEPKVDPSKFKNNLTVESLELEQNTLKISGVEFFSGISFNDSSKIKHELILKNNLNGNEASFNLETIEIEDYKLNDDFTYKYIGFKGDVDLTELKNGNFSIYIKVTNGEYSATILANSSSSRYSNIVSYNPNNGLSYRITANDRMSYRLELDKTNTIINYTNINKPTDRKSMFDLLDMIKLEEADDKAKLTINAAAVIYYMNFGKDSNPEYEVLLIKDNENYIATKANIVETPEGYADLISTTYALDKIAFVSETELANLKDGEYKIIIKVANGDKLDYINALVTGNIELPAIQTKNATYSIKKTVNDYLVLEVSNKNEEDVSALENVSEDANLDGGNNEKN